MSVVQFQVDRQTDFGDFGPRGRYRQLDGTVTFAVDPTNAANGNIVDLHLAPRNDLGLVEFSANFSLVTPEVPSNGNGRLLVEIPNRGNKLTGGHFHQTLEPGNAGDGFLCHRGFSFLSIGWQWDAQVDGGMKLEAPQASLDGQPVSGEILMKLQPDRDRPHLAMVQLGQTKPSYGVLDSTSDSHRLYAHHGEGRILIDRERWRFARASKDGTDGIEASDRHIYMADGFKAGVTYELVYQTTGAPVVGAGLLAIRDVAACLRYQDDASPVAAGFDHVFAFGISQTGRVLRQFLYENLNRDENNRVVYDGLLIHIAGGQRGDFNHRFAQPSVANIPGFGQRFPFAAGTTRDPISDREDGLFAKLDDDAIPKVIFSNTSWEYWRGDASLIHIQEGVDLPEHPNTRIYHIAGTHHIGGILPEGKQTNQLPMGLHTAVPLNVVNSAPVFRALFAALDNWVVDGTLPPDSRHPRISDHTAVSRQAVLEKFADQSNVPVPDTHKLPGIRLMDFGETESDGVTRQPVPELTPYAAYVSDVRSDLNEIAGIHLPDLACPLGYHSGWNPRSAEIGAADELATFAGFSVFFTRAEIEARYQDADAYIEQATRCIDELINAGFVLAEDRDWMINIARSRFQAAIEAGDRIR